MEGPCDYSCLKLMESTVCDKFLFIWRLVLDLGLDTPNLVCKKSSLMVSTSLMLTFVVRFRFTSTAPICMVALGLNFLESLVFES